MEPKLSASSSSAVPRPVSHQRKPSSSSLAVPSSITIPSTSPTTPAYSYDDNTFTEQLDTCKWGPGLIAYRGLYDPVKLGLLLPEVFEVLRQRGPPSTSFKPYRDLVWDAIKQTWKGQEERDEIMAGAPDWYHPEDSRDVESRPHSRSSSVSNNNLNASTSSDSKALNKKASVSDLGTKFGSGEPTRRSTSDPSNEKTVDKATSHGTAPAPASTTVPSSAPPAAPASPSGSTPSPLPTPPSSIAAIPSPPSPPPPPPPPPTPAATSASAPATTPSSAAAATATVPPGVPAAGGASSPVVGGLSSLPVPLPTLEEALLAPTPAPAPTAPPHVASSSSSSPPEDSAGGSPAPLPPPVVVPSSTSLEQPSPHPPSPHPATGAAVSSTSAVGSGSESESRSPEGEAAAAQPSSLLASDPSPPVSRIDAVSTSSLQQPLSSVITTQPSSSPPSSAVAVPAFETRETLIARASAAEASKDYLQKRVSDLERQNQVKEANGGIDARRAQTAELALGVMQSERDQARSEVGIFKGKEVEWQEEKFAQREKDADQRVRENALQLKVAVLQAQVEQLSSILSSSRSNDGLVEDSRQPQQPLHRTSTQEDRGRPAGAVNEIPIDAQPPSPIPLLSPSLSPDAHHDDMFPPPSPDDQEDDTDNEEGNVAAVKRRASFSSPSGPAPNPPVAINIQPSTPPGPETASPSLPYRRPDLPSRRSSPLATSGPYSDGFDDNGTEDVDTDGEEGAFVGRGREGKTRVGDQGSGTRVRTTSVGVDQTRVGGGELEGGSGKVGGGDGGVVEEWLGLKRSGTTSSGNGRDREPSPEPTSVSTSIRRRGRSASQESPSQPASSTLRRSASSRSTRLSTATLGLHNLHDLETPTKECRTDKARNLSVSSNANGGMDDSQSDTGSNVSATRSSVGGYDDEPEGPPAARGTVARNLLRILGISSSPVLPEGTDAVNGDPIEALKPFQQIYRVGDIKEQAMDSLAALLDPIFATPAATVEEVISVFIPLAVAKERLRLKTYIDVITSPLTNNTHDAKIIFYNPYLDAEGLWPEADKAIYLRRLKHLYLLLHLLSLVRSRSAFTDLVNSKEKTFWSYTDIVSNEDRRKKYSHLVVGLEKMEKRHFAAVKAIRALKKTN